MKTITLKRLTLKNFKKIQDLTIDFSQKTQINGANGAGKTTVFDSFSWLLYGKNSNDQADFSIKTLDANNEAIPKLVHSVEAVLDINGEEKVFRRELREKWTKKRGNDFEEMTGHETKFFVNDIPLQKKEYSEEVSGLISEELSKMITNPNHFNGVLHWTERREVLSKIAGTITDQDVLNEMNQNDIKEDLINLIDSGSDLDLKKREISAKKNAIKQERDAIKPRIEEVQNMKPENVDFQDLRNELESFETTRKEINEELEDASKDLERQREEISRKKSEKFDKEEKLREMEREQKIQASSGDSTTNKINELEIKRNDLSLNIGEFKRTISNVEITIDNLKKQKEAKLQEWKTEKAKVFQPQSDTCSTCKQTLPNAAETNENLSANFEREKLTKLKAIETEGEKLKNDIETLEKSVESKSEEIKVLDNDFQDLKSQIETLKQSIQQPKAIEPTPEMIQLKKEIDEFVIPDLKEPESTTEKKEKLEQISKHIDWIKRELSKEDQIKKADERIQELENQRKTLSQELANLERVEIQIDKFIKAQTELIESRVNSKFNLVRFKMFETQLNGGESLACECLVDGVPFKDLNTATQINAGLDVINTLQAHFETLAPVFIDKKESVSTIIPIKCQQITLKVDPTAQKLQIINGN